MARKHARGYAAAQSEKQLLWELVVGIVVVLVVAVGVDVAVKVVVGVGSRLRCWCRCLCRMWQCNASFIWQRQQRTRLPHAARRTWAKTKTKRHAAVGGKDEGHANNLQAVAKLCFHLAAARGRGKRGNGRWRWNAGRCRQHLPNKL